MSAVLPDPLAASYRDPKKPLWLLPALTPPSWPRARWPT